ncbi:hypothetical protein [uncultured Algimonas sp.]|uniref:hypothetical protein n=1 Tax=uncultured Algimonas sp. TaxID=1547920 RepID=UPI002623A1D1|nr:hypothetical protein [uncultured Algimonas sp.]
MLRSCLTSDRAEPERQALANNIRSSMESFASQPPGLCGPVWNRHAAKAKARLDDTHACGSTLAAQSGPLARELLRRCSWDQHLLGLTSDGLSIEASSCAPGAARIPVLQTAVVRMENASWLDRLSREQIVRFYRSDKTREAIYVLVQHAEMFQTTQRSVLDALLAAHEAEPDLGQPIAALHDRLQIASDGTQTYGTHTHCPAPGPAVPGFPIDHRPVAGFPTRESLGLAALDDFLAKRCRPSEQDGE